MNRKGFALGFYCCDETPMTKSNLGRNRVYFILHFRITVHHQGRNLKAEIDAEA